MRAFLIATIIACPSCALAEGAALPDFHLDDKCKGQGKSLTGKETGAVVEECVKAERDAYDNLKNYWPKLDEKQKTKCLAASSSQKLGNYRILQQCLNRDELKVDGKVKPDLKR